MNGLCITDLDETAETDGGDVLGSSEEGAPCSSVVLGDVCDGMEPLNGELAWMSSIGEVQTGLFDANFNAYCRTSTKGNRLGPEPYLKYLSSLCCNTVR